MKIIVTCGPSYEPIDEVRRLTNFSSGQLGVSLSNAFMEAGFDVFCLKGSAATSADPDPRCRLHSFDTNDDLLDSLRRLSLEHEIAAVFHVAALCDYRVSRVEDDQGRSCDSPKIASRSGALTISLKPATKVIAEMRQLFPDSAIVGWKYELAGSRSEAVAKALRQIQDNDTDACVLNGRAFGSGFGFFQSGRPTMECQDKAEVVRFLVLWLKETLRRRGLAERSIHSGLMVSVNR